MASRVTGFLSLLQFVNMLELIPVTIFKLSRNRIECHLSELVVITEAHAQPPEICNWSYLVTKLSFILSFTIATFGSNISQPVA